VKAARQFTKYAIAAYSDSQTSLLGGARFTLANVAVSYFSVPETGHVLAIAGTDELTDIGNWTPEVSHQGGLAVHKGALLYAEIVLRLIPKEVVESIGTLTLVGHSLGGAAAIMLPLLAPALARENVQVVTYGSPRCIRAMCGAEYPEEVQVTRVVLAHDPVPDVPLRWTCFPAGGWEHVGTPLYVNGGQWTEVTGWWHVCRRIERTAILALSMLRGKLAARVRLMHSMQTYRDKLGVTA
jgi:hypothetical protein